MSYSISQIQPRDRRAMDQLDCLLARTGIRRDGCLDYICGLFDEDYQLVATGGCYGSTLRCFAVDQHHQGEGLLNIVLSHLLQVQADRGNLHVFLYTKPETAPFLRDVGFFEIARVPDRLVFMENRKNGFSGYAAALAETARPDGVSAAVVMNANPFTLGHQYLAETAAAACDTLHLFVVSEDASLVPASVRRMLVEKGTAHLPNVILHDCGPYMISSATFPSYFLKDQQTVMETQARLDLALFLRIAPALRVTARFVGEEPLSQVTGIYNRVMEQMLPEAGIACRVLPRKTLNGRIISASAARLALQRNDLAAFREWVPASTWEWFSSPEAQPVIQRIQSTENVIHD